METHGGPRGAACREGFLYVSVKVGYYAHIARHDLKTGERQVVIDQVPSGGWHEPGGSRTRRPTAGAAGSSARWTASSSMQAFALTGVLWRIKRR